MSYKRQQKEWIVDGLRLGWLDVYRTMQMTSGKVGTLNFYSKSHGGRDIFILRPKSIPPYSLLKI